MSGFNVFFSTSASSFVTKRLLFLANTNPIHSGIHVFANSISQLLLNPHNFIFGLNDNTIPVDISHYPLSSKDFDCEDYFYYVDVNGDKVTGEQTIDNVPVYFHSNGKQAKGELVTVDGKIHYYDANSGARLSNIDITIKGQTYHFDADGNGTPIS